MIAENLMNGTDRMMMNPVHPVQMFSSNSFGTAKYAKVRENNGLVLSLLSRFSWLFKVFRVSSLVVLRSPSMMTRSLRPNDEGVLSCKPFSTRPR
jgi:hypothetical protein